MLAQLYSGNVVFLGPPSLEEYQMHRVQHFNIQGRIYTYVNYTLQFSSEPMRQLSMSLPMTNIWTHCFYHVTSTALYSEASSQQQSYFSVLEQVAQASRLQQQLRLFLQDEDNRSLSTSSTSANFNIITQKIGKLFCPQFPSSTSDCYRPIPQLCFDPSDTPHLCLDHTFILSCYVQFVQSFPPSGLSFSSLDNHTFSPATSTYHTSFPMPGIPGEC